MESLEEKEMVGVACSRNSGNSSWWFFRSFFSSKHWWYAWVTYKNSRKATSWILTTHTSAKKENAATSGSFVYCSGHWPGMVSPPTYVSTLVSHIFCEVENKWNKSTASGEEVVAFRTIFGTTKKYIWQNPNFVYARRRRDLNGFGSGGGRKGGGGDNTLLSSSFPEFANPPRKRKWRRIFLCLPQSFGFGFFRRRRRRGRL